MPYLESDYRNMEMVHTWKIKIKNIDEEKLSDFHYNTLKKSTKNLMHLI